MPGKTAVVTRIFERHACYFVEGKALKDGLGWVPAEFTVHKPDVEGMPREAFLAFCERQLPHVTKDIDWSPYVNAA